MQKTKYEFNSIDFLNATVEEIYYRKKHYIGGKELLTFKGVLSAYFVQIERTFRYVYLSDISLDTNRVDMGLFQRHFPFIFDTFNNQSYKAYREGDETYILDGVAYYTWILEQLRNLNLHAVVSTAVAKIFTVEEAFVNLIPKFSDKVQYLKDGILTVGGMLGMLLPVLNNDSAEYLLGYIFQQWGESLFEVDFHHSFAVREELWGNLKSIYQTNYEAKIRENVATKNILDAIFGRERSNLQVKPIENGEHFVLDLSQATKAPKFQAIGKIQEKEDETIVSVEQGSNIGVYFSEEYELKIKDVELFTEFSLLVPPFMAIAYLYHNGVAVFDEAAYQSVNQFFFTKLNYAKFYVNKDIPILCYGNKYADIREMSKVISANLLRMFLDFEESVVFRKDILVYGTYSRFKDAMKALDVPYVLAGKLIACRNFCSHEGILNNFHYYTPEKGYKITLDFICQTIDEFIIFLKAHGEFEHAYHMQKNLEEYILKTLIGSKYKRIFETSIKLFRSYGDRVATHCTAIKKSLGAVYNSCIDPITEEALAKRMKDKFEFHIAPTLWELPENTFRFKKLALYRIYEKGLEIKEGKTGVEILEFFETPATRLNKITKNGAPVQLELIEEKQEGIVLVRSYKVK